MTVWSCVPDSHLHRVDTVIYPYDGQIVARNM